MKPKHELRVLIGAAMLAAAAHAIPQGFYIDDAPAGGGCIDEGRARTRGTLDPAAPDHPVVPRSRFLE